MAREISTRVELGARIAEAREALGMTQSELANSLGIERSILAKMENGSRKVSATELVELASALRRPLDWFVVESPSAVVSRRRSSTAEFAELDSTLERVSRDVERLVERGLLNVAPRPSFETPRSINEAIALAARIRRELDQISGPLLDLQTACESLGLLAFSIFLGFGAGDAVYAEVGPGGVAIINGSTDPGRRRFSLAHELGHHVIGDAYEGTDSGSETEHLLNAAAVHLLMPGDSVRQAWQGLEQRYGPRLRALALAVEYRVSWSAACGQLRNLGLISYQNLEELIEVEPQKWEFLELGMGWEAELEPPAVPRGYARQVIDGYRLGRLTDTKTVELLHGTLDERELPPREPPSEAEVIEMIRPGR